MTTLAGADIVRAVIRDRAPADAAIRMGGLPASDPEKAIAVQDNGGRESEYFVGPDPRYVTDRVLLIVRDRNRDSEQANRWMRWTMAVLREALQHQYGSPPVARVEEDVEITNCQPPAPVSSTLPEVWIRESGGPRWRRAPGDGRYVAVEMSLSVRFRPLRTLPLTAPFGPWSSDRYPVDGTVHVARATTIPPAGRPGRVVIGGQVTSGAAVTRMLPADDRVPTGRVRQATPLEDRPDGLLWYNANIATEDRSGVLDIFHGVSTSASTVRPGVRILRADVLDADNTLRVRVSARFDAADAQHYAFLLQDHPPDVHRYVLRLSDAVEGVTEGDLTYTFPFVPAVKIEPTDQWDWSLVDLRLFRLEPVQSVLPPAPRWRVRWRARWQGASGFLGESLLEFGGAGTQQVPWIEPQRAAGGVLEQVVDVEHVGDLTRAQGYAVALTADGSILYGERVPTGDEAPAGQSRAHTEGFDAGFGHE